MPCTYYESCKRFGTRLVNVDCANPSSATRIVVEEPEGNFWIRYNDRELCDGTVVASVAVPGVKAINGRICLVGWDTRRCECRTCGRMVSLGDCHVVFHPQDSTQNVQENDDWQLNRITSSWSALTVCGTKTAPGLEVVLPPTVITIVFAEVNKSRESQATKTTGCIFVKVRREGTRGAIRTLRNDAVFFFITLSSWRKWRRE